jgi:hypothetical protein
MSSYIVTPPAESDIGGCGGELVLEGERFLPHVSGFDATIDKLAFITHP